MGYIDSSSNQALGTALVDDATQFEQQQLQAEDIDAYMAQAEGENPPVLGLNNGRFDITDPANAGYYWTTRGTASVSQSHGVINEDASIFRPGFEQAFIVPAGAQAIRFSILSLDLHAHAGQPPDAFEVAFLENDATPATLVPVPTNPEIGNTDAFLNIQPTGQVFYGSGTSVTNVGASGSFNTLQFPMVVTVDISAVPAGTVGRLYFDLLGVDSVIDSSITIDTVTIVGVDPPPLTVALDPASDSGTKGDGITNINSVKLTGSTDPLTTLRLDKDNDGFDDATVIADTSGNFTFNAIPLANGANPLRVQAGEPTGATIKSVPVTLDNAGPTATLSYPTPGASLIEDRGYVEIQWSDAAGLNATTFDKNDITINGVTVDQAVNLGSGLIRYYYNTADTDILPAGAIAVTVVANQVQDNAGNSNALQTANFTLLMSLDAGNKTTGTIGSAVSLNNARFRFNGNHSVLTLTVNWGDNTGDQNVTVPAGTGGANITGSHTYTSGGLFTITLTLRDNASHVATDTTTAGVVAVGCPWRNPVKFLDVDGKNGVTPIDAVLIINQLNAIGPGNLPNPAIPPNVPPPFFDVDCDNFLGPTDAVLVINALNSGAGEGEAAVELPVEDIDVTDALLANAGIPLDFISEKTSQTEPPAAKSATDAVAYWWAQYLLAQAADSQKR
jgi:hypothetical protein